MTHPDFMETAEMIRGGMENGPDAVMIVDAAGVIQFVNTQAALLTGRPVKDLLGHPVETLIPEELRTAHRDVHRPGYLRNPYRRLMGTDRDLVILQRAEAGDIPVRVSINLAPFVTNTKVMIVLTIRQPDTSIWRGS